MILGRRLARITTLLGAVFTDWPLGPLLTGNRCRFGHPPLGQIAVGLIRQGLREWCYGNGQVHSCKKEVPTLTGADHDLKCRVFAEGGCALSNTAGETDGTHPELEDQNLNAHIV